MYNYANPGNYLDLYGYYAEVFELQDKYVVASTVYIYGDGASSDLAAKWEKWVEESWNVGTQFNEKEVTFDVTFISVDIPADKYENPRGAYLDYGYRNILRVEKGNITDEQPYVSFDTSSSSPFSGVWYSDMSKGYVRHEMGHIFGLYDRYWNAWSVMGVIWPWSGVRNGDILNIMNSKDYQYNKFYPYNPNYNYASMQC